MYLPANIKKLTVNGHFTCWSNRKKTLKFNIVNVAVFSEIPCRLSSHFRFRWTTLSEKDNFLSPAAFYVLWFFRKDFLELLLYLESERSALNQWQLSALWPTERLGEFLYGPCWASSDGGVRRANGRVMGYQSHRCEINGSARRNQSKQRYIGQSILSVMME